MGIEKREGFQKLTGLKEDEIYNTKRKLRINKKCRLGRRLEDIEEFSESYFQNNYYDAFLLTQRIVSQNQKIQQEWESQKKNNNESIGEERLYNIIAFCGERGTGKTSVMHSVIKALQSKPEAYKKFIIKYEERENIYGERMAEETFISQMLDKYEFICMDGIDASLLEDKENILDVVLSKMLQKFQGNMKKCDKNYLWIMEDGGSSSKREIYRKFEEICQNKRRFLGEMNTPYTIGESSAEQLSSLAGSMEIRENMQELVSMYLQILGNEKGKNYQYMVVSIDDLDMHVNAYEMLEQLHRYLMIPQVIIYLAISDRETQSVCKKHFEKMYDRPTELAISYLEKVLPYFQRIYLPATYYGDFFNVIVESDYGEMEFSIKEYLLRGIAQKTHVFYDSQGGDAHFYEIGNLRTLFNMHYLLESMKKVERGDLLHERAAIREDKKYREVLDINIDKLKNDVIGRMVTEKLNDSKQQRIFRKYYEEDFSSNGEYMVEQIVKILNDNDFSTDYETFGYSYGELINALHSLSKRKQEYKPFVQCVLAYATIELTQNYIYAFCLRDKHSQIKWKEYISGTICGSFGNRLLPKVKKQGNNNQNEENNKAIAYVKDCIINTKITLHAPREAVHQKNELSDDYKYNMCVSFIENNQYKFVESVELFLMFISKKDKIEAKNYGMSMEWLTESGKTDMEVCIHLGEWECTFDFLGFVVKSMDWENYFKNVDEMILKMLKEYYCVDGSELTPEKKEALEKKISEQSLRKKYESWDKIHSGMALPIYSLDIMYNILKRAMKKMEKEFSKMIVQEDFLTAIKKFYKVLKECLEAEDIFYNRVGETEKRKKDDSFRVSEKPEEDENKRDYSDFLKAFLECPYIQPFIKEELPEVFVSLFNIMTEKLIEG